MIPYGSYPKLTVHPWTVKRAHALAFNAAVHRRQPKVQGALWCIAVREGGAVVGVALVGLPPRLFQTPELDTLCVLRMAVKEGYKNACSMLYGACWRTARGQGATSLVTYTHLDEPGTSLKAAGWVSDGTTKGGEWDRKKRPRAKAVDANPKVRWWAPGSRRLLRPLEPEQRTSAATVRDGLPALHAADLPGVHVGRVPVVADEVADRHPAPVEDVPASVGPARAFGHSTHEDSAGIRRKRGTHG